MVCYIQDEPGLHARPDTKSISATSMPKAFDPVLNANAITIRRSIAAASNYMSSCAYRKSNPDIFVMQSAEGRAAKNSPCAHYGAR